MNRMKLVSRSAAAIGVATALAMASGVACASSLNFNPAIFIGQNNMGHIAVTDPVTGLSWVTPNIAGNDNYSDLQQLCPGSVCGGPLAGLTWASDGQVNTFWHDIGVPLNSTQSYVGIAGASVLSSLIAVMGPTHTISATTGSGAFEFGENTFILGGLTFGPTLLSVPNTSYMEHNDLYVFGRQTDLDTESAWTYGAGNGYAEDPATGGWFYFTPSTGGTTPVPEPGSLGMLGLGLGLLGLGFAWEQRRRRNRMDRTGGMPTDGHALA